MFVFAWHKHPADLSANYCCYVRQFSVVLSAITNDSTISPH